MIVVALNDPAEIPLVTVSEPSVPIVVMLDWFAVCRVPVIVVALNDPDAISPVTDNENRVPIVVIYVWLAVLIVP